VLIACKTGMTSDSEAGVRTWHTTNFQK